MTREQIATLKWNTALFTHFDLFSVLLSLFDFFDSSISRLPEEFKLGEDCLLMFRFNIGRYWKKLLVKYGT